MTPEPANPITITLQPIQVERPALPEAPAAPAAPAPSREEVQALEAVFKPTADDNSAAPAFFGVWAGGMLLHDVLQDHLSRPKEADEDEDRPKKAQPPQG